MTYPIDRIYRSERTGYVTTYQEFLASKQRVFHGLGSETTTLSDRLFDWQRAIVKWAVRKGRAAIWADCGLGKTLMQLEWARQLDQRTIIFAPLCVAEQTAVEASTNLGMTVRYATDQAAAGSEQFIVSNYERLDSFDLSKFGAVVLDESSILKSFDGKTRSKLIAVCAQVPYRLCCTATPAPNDIAELANHAEFLGLMTRPEFLATWFVHDDEGWRMKRHATEPFYRWLASWAVALRKPSDLGYADDGFALPALEIRERLIEVESTGGETLFPEMGLKGLSGRLSARRDGLTARVEAIRLMTWGGRAHTAADSCQWLVWCGLNDESDALAEAIPDALNVQGSDSYAVKRDAVRGFLAGDVRVLITKAKILGFGMNFQQCHHMVFAGIGDSYETYYQCLRRCWRFGQKMPVTAYIVVSPAERLIVENVRRKEQTADTLSAELLAQMRTFEREELCA